MTNLERLWRAQGSTCGGLETRLEGKFYSGEATAIRPGNRVGRRKVAGIRLPRDIRYPTISLSVCRAWLPTAFFPLDKMRQPNNPVVDVILYHHRLRSVLKSPGVGLSLTRINFG